MESYAFQDLPPKRIKKYAARFSDDEIKASLNEDADNIPFIFEHGERASVMVWNAFSGPMAVLDEDSVRAFAQLGFLRRHGYPRFTSFEELEAYASSHSWPRKNRGEHPSA